MYHNIPSSTQMFFSFTSFLHTSRLWVTESEHVHYLLTFQPCLQFWPRCALPECGLNSSFCFYTSFLLLFVYFFLWLKLVLKTLLKALFYCANALHLFCPGKVSAFIVNLIYLFRFQVIFLSLGCRATGPFPCQLSEQRLQQQCWAVPLQKHGHAGLHRTVQSSDRHTCCTAAR